MKTWKLVFTVMAFTAIFGFVGCGGDGDNNGDKDLTGNISISPTTATVGTVLTATYSGTETVNYQWNKSGTPINETANTFTPSEIGSYTVTVSLSGYKSKTSGAVIVTAKVVTADYRQTYTGNYRPNDQDYYGGVNVIVGENTITISGGDLPSPVIINGVYSNGGGVLDTGEYAPGKWEYIYRDETKMGVIFYATTEGNGAYRLFCGFSIKSDNQTAFEAMFDTILDLTGVEDYPQLNVRTGLQTVAKPTATIPEGTVASGTTVSLETITEGASIYYTLNGDNPSSTNWTLFVSPITINQDMVIKAIAVKNGMSDSEILTVSYILSRPIATIFYNDNEIAQNGLIDAGSVTISQSTYITIVIKNTGTLPLTVSQSDIAIIGNDASSFNKVTNPGVTIPAGGQSQFMIQFTPSKTGEHNATLNIPTNDNNRNPVVVLLKGTGIE